ncbi:uncharacterized protein K452DRAFT_303246 [Aplosporella prunicola CBS 121167]|uniref:histidine kinase n=1 Tax=Aplosporella prunicola CBS 121167 TaxID=1176127 RepID=A0A6A6AVX7_9PEZI|nr:uncharacterized protein K452DRAFT_303246 [Aplosporella prunicola CBS 121167]KAF2135850.1 hypothetical protein K452DRAFT_303246 [Aplosporella prunicola CBS 121167]
MTARRPTTYFPRSDGIYKRREHHNLPARPSNVEPIFDREHANQPLAPYDDDAANSVYLEGPSTPVSSPLPPKPPKFANRYLFPVLARNERLRLTMLWYYTRGITQDTELLQKLQGIVNLVRGYIGWEFVIMGILDNDVYMRLVTDGLPLAVLPRRESTCSHTINQESGVLVLPSMSEDWRFRHSPHVVEGGLQSYAGAALRYETEDGQKISLGSLCVAANAPIELPPEKQSALARFADILTAEIVNQCRMSRQRQRQIMGDLLSKAKAQATSANVEKLVKMVVSKIYPEAQISFQDVDAGTLHVENRLPVALSQVEDGLWEDSEYLELLILTHNHQKLTSRQSVRAVFGKCSRAPYNRYLVVASRDVQFVFDDVDAWFVESCAQIYCNIYQEYLLAEALKAKETFLRGITHQLRTPIHGILGSVELLGEELGSLNHSAAVGSDEREQSMRTAQLYLQAIQNSGRELMSTVNNMLMLNQWAESSRSVRTATLYELTRLESDILRDISQMLPEDEIVNTSVLFDNRLSVECSIITTDIALLKECLQSLILNAIQSTSHGSVLVETSASDNYSVLQFDVKDTGTGISKEDQHRIFDAYEKGDSHSRGVGLGLTIASKIATALDGTVFLVSSELGKGSHFRAEFHNPGFACPSKPLPHLDSTALHGIPRHFHEIPTGRDAAPLVRHFMSFLQHRGYEHSSKSYDSLNIISFTEDESEFQRSLALVDPSAVAICLVPGRKTMAHLRVPDGYNKLLFFNGPFNSDHLNSILKQVDEMCPTLLSLPPINQPRKCVPPPPVEEICDLFTKTARIHEAPSALIVDDNIINMRIMRMYCEKRKIPYAMAADGNEAIAQFKACAAKAQPINLILMDLQMPNCDGVEATATIRSLEVELAPHRHKAVVFIITGQDSPEDKASSFAAGANEFFVKPLSIKALDNGISLYFDQSNTKAGAKANG